MRLKPTVIAIGALALVVGRATRAANETDTAATDTAAVEHSEIGVAEDKSGAHGHTQHPDAQWYPQAGLGLFIHWGIASVRAMNISWPMIPGRVLATRKLDAAERERIVRESDYNLDGKPPAITPNEYWTMARDFNPRHYDPDKWLKAARDAGFTYVVLTTRHHEGFALWPSAYGDFNTKNYMGGRDLVKPFVEACRRNGLKVGLYYSPPDWYFDRDIMDFLYHGAHKTNPEFPPLGPDLKPRVPLPPKDLVARTEAAHAAMVRGQVEELLTHYGKIDLLWFDGKPPGPHGADCITEQEIRRLQPGIVINPRLWGHGDFVTYERKLPPARPNVGWAEFCNPWNGSWSYQKLPFHSNGFILGQYVMCRAWGINDLLGIGPDADGEMSDDVYRNMGEVRDWLKVNGSSVHGTLPLPNGETASDPATMHGAIRYLFALPRFKNGGMNDRDQLPAEDETLTLKGVARPRTVTLLGDGKALQYDYAGDTVTVQLPAARRTRLVDVVQVQLEGAP